LTAEAVKTNAGPGAPSSATKDELVAMLPASDLIAVVDIGARSMSCCLSWPASRLGRSG